MSDLSFIGSIDQGTSSSRFILFDCATGEAFAQHSQEVQQFCPREGWLEQDPIELLDSVHACINAVCEELKEKNISLNSVKAVGITNQRETTVVWSRTTGKPLARAVVWADGRNGEDIQKMVEKYGQDHLRKQTGLPLATYFSATKLIWLRENCKEVMDAMEEENLYFGTVDSWLIWNLTGGLQGGQHVTDVTNASRTLLMDLRSLDWDPQLLQFFQLPSSILPRIKPSSGYFGDISLGVLKGIPIRGVVGDQQAALLGHGCTATGEVKSTYGTGCFMLYNTGLELIESKFGLLTTVAFQEEGKPPTYALEGSVAVAGLAIRWLKNNLGLISSFEEVTTLAEGVDRTDGVYFVPAFAGLFAPHWRPDARGTICGLSAHTTKHHIARATLEAVAFQVVEVFEAMKKDHGTPPNQLLVDGGLTQSQVMLQQQANLLGINVAKSNFTEVTALGAAIAAGVGVPEWTLPLGYKIRDITMFRPQVDDVERERKVKRWRMAVERSLDWE